MAVYVSCMVVCVFYGLWLYVYSMAMCKLWLYMAVCVFFRGSAFRTFIWLCMAVYGYMCVNVSLSMVLYVWFRHELLVVIQVFRGSGQGC